MEYYVLYIEYLILDSTKSEERIGFTIYVRVSYTFISLVSFKCIVFSSCRKVLKVSYGFFYTLREFHLGGTYFTYTSKKHFSVRVFSYFPDSHLHFEFSGNH